MTIPRASLSYTFDNVIIQPNATVHAGQHLGFSITGPDFAPYCHLEYNNQDPSKVLLQQGQGQNSARGLDGKTRPVYLRSGKGVKFLAVVQ